MLDAVFAQQMPSDCLASRSFVATETGARSASLENIANKVALPGKSGIDYRVERWAARGFLWQESGMKRVRSCGRWAINPTGEVKVRANGAAVGYAGLASCGSVWVCPVCNARIQAVRRIEVGLAIAYIQAQGGSAAFGAYTLRHHKGQSLETLWRGLSYCWKAVHQDKTVRNTRKRLGYIGTIRAVECTHGCHGFHPHIHPLHLFDRVVTLEEVASLEAAEFRAWAAAAARKGLQAPTIAAQDLHLVIGDASDALGEYFTKTVYQPSSASVGWEMTSTQTKSRTRAKDSRTPWELLADARTNGDADAWDAWQEWEKASKGKRALTWSRGLRKFVGLDLEATDEEIASAEIGTDADTGFIITDWSPIRSSPRLGAELLGIIGQGKNWAAGLAFCAAHGIQTREI